MTEEHLLREQLLAAYREIAPEHSVGGEFLVRKLAAALFARGGRVTIGTVHTEEKTIHHSLDAGHKIVWTDKVWNAVMGYRSGTVVGHPIGEFITADSLAFLNEVAWPQLMRDGKTGPHAFTFVTYQGVLLPAMGRSEVLRDSTGAFERTFARIRVKVALGIDVAAPILGVLARND